jgi:hypothetical protein
VTPLVIEAAGGVLEKAEFPAMGHEVIDFVCAAGIGGNSDGRAELTKGSLSVAETVGFRGKRKWRMDAGLVRRR